ncbi:MAG: SRPBCC family protein [Polyangiaceae bacterium]
MSTTVPNKIEKQIELKAPLGRVWKAVTDAQEFGAWFGVKLEGQFQAGKQIEGKLKSERYGDLTMKVTVKEISPKTAFSFTWIPFGIDPEYDYSKEDPTLVKFTFETTPTGTLLRVTEEGFDHVPLVRRAKAFESNVQGWAIQMKQIEEYLKNAA